MTETEFYKSLTSRELKNCARTPASLFDSLHAEFGFTLDAAACPWDAKLPRFNSPMETRYGWAGERVWCNPPWTWAGAWVQHAFDAMDIGCPLSVMLVPAGLSSRWFDRYAAYATEVRRVGRIKFAPPPGVTYSTPMWEALVLVFEAGKLNTNPLRPNFVLCDKLGRPLRAA